MAVDSNNDKQATDGIGPGSTNLNNMTEISQGPGLQEIQVEKFEQELDLIKKNETIKEHLQRLKEGDSGLTDEFRNGEHPNAYPRLPNYSLYSRLEKLAKKIADLKAMKREIMIKERMVLESLQPEECWAIIKEFRLNEIKKLEEWKESTLGRLKRTQEGQYKSFDNELDTLNFDQSELNKTSDLMDRRLTNLEFQR